MAIHNYVDQFLVSFLRYDLACACPSIAPAVVCSGSPALHLLRTFQLFSCFSCSCLTLCSLHPSIVPASPSLQHLLPLLLCPLPQKNERSRRQRCFSLHSAHSYPTKALPSLPLITKAGAPQDRLRYCKPANHSASCSRERIIVRERATDAAKRLVRHACLLCAVGSLFLPSWELRFTMLLQSGSLDLYTIFLALSLASFLSFSSFFLNIHATYLFFCSLCLSSPCRPLQFPSLALLLISVVL